MDRVRYSLRTLGTLSLTDQAGRELDAVLAQPKRTALLAYLAVENRAFQRRDTLLALLWPGFSEERARNALNKSVYFLRTHLGKETLVSRGNEELGLAPGAIWTDAVALTGAIRDARVEEAITLYRGPFLEGFHVSGSVEFEEWVHHRRHRLERSCAQALESLAESAMERGDPKAAAARWKELVAHDPTSARATIGLMRSLESIGERGAALDEAGRHGAAMREALEAEPDPQVVAFADRLRARPRRIPAASPESRVIPGYGVGRAVPRRRRPFARALLVAAMGVGAFMTWALLASRGPEPPASLDPGMVAVAPFRLTAPDSTLGYLREGMVDLLAAKLAGGSGLRAVEPRTLLSVWRERRPDGTPDVKAALETARSLGASQLLLGSIVDAAPSVVLQASILSVPEGGIRARAAVEGPPDSLLALVDRLVVRLVALESGESEPEHLASLVSASLPAVRAYLDGRKAYREGRYDAAIDHFEGALAMDSTFALAGVGLVSASRLSFTGGNQRRGFEVALRWKERLGEDDRLYVTTLAGPSYPAWSHSPAFLEGWEVAVRRLGDRPEAWYELGDVLFHGGARLGVPDHRGRARAAFTRALRLAPDFTPALEHLFLLEMDAGDTVAMRALARRYLARDSVGRTADAIRWTAAIAAGDRDLARDRSFSSLDTEALAAVILNLELAGRGSRQAERALLEMERRASSREERTFTAAWRRRVALNGGRPAEARRAITVLEEGIGRRSADRIRVFDALEWNGDAVAGARAADRLWTTSARGGAPRDPAERKARLGDLCWAELWRVRHGELATVEASAERLRAAGDFTTAAGARHGLCAEILAALRAASTAEPDARDRMDGLLALLREDPPGHGPASLHAVARLAIARFHESQGDLEAALEALRARGRAPYAHSTFLREEGRLAALASDRIGALRAYGHYLALRHSPESSLAGRVAATRAQVAAWHAER